jgi:hypothetical protein
MRRVRTASSLVVEQLVGVLEADQDIMKFYEIRRRTKPSDWERAESKRLPEHSLLELRKCLPWLRSLVASI